MPTDLRRRDDIAAAVAAYDGANPNAPLPRNAARLLAVMFPSEDVCQQSPEAIVAEGFGRSQPPCDFATSGRGRVPVQAPGFGRCASHLSSAPAAGAVMRCQRREKVFGPRPRGAAGDVCQQSQEVIVAEGFGRSQPPCDFATSGRDR